MAVIGNGLGILGWANNGGRGWTSTGVTWDLYEKLVLFANLWIFCHDDQIPAWEEKVSYRHCCWETGVHAWKLSQRRHMNFSFLRSSWRLLQFHQPWNSPIHARLSPPSLQALPNAATLQCICFDSHMYKLEVLKTSALCAQGPHLCMILWRLLNHVQDVNGSIRRNQLVTENVIHLTNQTFQRKEMNISIPSLCHNLFTQPMSQSWSHFLINQYTMKGDKRFLITMGNSCLEFTLECGINKTGLHNNTFVQYSAGISGDTSRAARVWWTA